MNKLIVNCETGEETLRELNVEELTQLKTDQANYDQFLKDQEAQAEAKAIARADLLEKLGITAEEAVLLLS